MTQRLLFSGYDTNNNQGLWVTDGTAAGTTELMPSGASTSDFQPNGFTAYNGKVLFQGYDTNNHPKLWVTDGTAAGTTEILPSGTNIGFFPDNFAVYNGKVLFDGEDASNYLNLWVTDGTAAGTTEILPTGANSSGLAPTNLTVYNGKVLFLGYDTNRHQQLWVTDGTAAGTTEILPSGIDSGGFYPASFTVANGKVLFTGYDANHHSGLWVTDGTAAGTTEILPSSGSSDGIRPYYLTSFNGKVLFEGVDSSSHYSLFVSDGTSAGTTEIVPSSGVGRNGLNPSDFGVYNGKVLFAGSGSNYSDDLWVTDGTLAGTTKLQPSGAASSGVAPSQFTVYNGKVLFLGYDASGHRGLWVTDGTSAGTTAILPSGVSSRGLQPDSLTVFNGKALFVGIDTSNHAGLWITDGTSAGTTEIQPSGARSSGFDPLAFTLVGLPDPATVSAVQATPSVAGPLGTGHTISFTLTPSAAVTVSTTNGSPTLTLGDGASATYMGQDSGGNLLFSLTIASGEDTADLHVTGLALGGSAITDANNLALDASALAALAGADTGLTIDTSPPAAPVITSADLTDMATPVISGTAEAGSTVTLTIGGATYTTTAELGGAWSIDLAATPSSGSLSLDTNGSNAITATATDTAGNMSGSATQALTIDTTPPAAPAITSPALTDSAAPVITGTAEAGSTVTLTVDGVDYTTVATGGAWSVNLATATPTIGILSLNLNGINEVGATATDPAGNVSSPTSQALTIDTTPPAAPAGLALAAGSDGGVLGDGITNVTQPTITGTGETGDTLTLYDGDVAIGTATVSNGTWSVTPSMALVAGSHSLTARQTDPAGNVSVASSVLPLTIDTTFPAAPSGLALAAGSDSGVVGDGITSVTSPVIDGTGMAGDTVKLYDGTTLLGTTTVAAGGAWSFTGGPLADGTYSLTTTQASPAGNVSAASAPFALTIETGTPNVTAMLVANPHDTASATYNQVLDGGGDPNASVTISDGGVVIGTATADATGAWSFDLAGLATGSHSLVASEANAAGTTGASAAAPLTVAPAVVPDTRFTLATGSTATSGKFFGSDYAGPLPGLQAQYGYVGTANVNVVANVANTFIYSGTGGEDALVANSGSNVLDSRGGSDWMIGASGADGGTDTFFVDSRASGSPTTWDTALNFHVGDKLTIWDFNPTNGSMSFTNNLGQPGYTGTTLEASLGNGATDLVTFAGLSGGASHFVTSTGTSGGLGYLAVTRAS